MLAWSQKQLFHSAEPNINHIIFGHRVLEIITFTLNCHSGVERYNLSKRDETNRYEQSQTTNAVLEEPGRHQMGFGFWHQFHTVLPEVFRSTATDPA